LARSAVATQRLEGMQDEGARAPGAERGERCRAREMDDPRDLLEARRELGDRGIGDGEDDDVRAVGPGAVPDESGLEAGGLEARGDRGAGSAGAEDGELQSVDRGTPRWDGVLRRSVEVLDEDPPRLGRPPIGRRR
jgi:hypothetical protein